MDSYSLKPGWQLYRFDQIALNVNERVEPGDTDLTHYVGLEHLDSDSLKIRRWGTPEDVEATKLRFRQGDIIFGRRRVYQRKLAVAEFDGICSAHAMVLRPRPEVVLPEFLPFFMQSDLFMHRALEISVGSLSPTINWRTLAAQEFPLPTPDEQRRLVEVLRAMSAVGESYKSLALETERLWQSLAFKRFSDAYAYGKLTRLSDLLLYASDGPFGSKLKTEHYAKSGARVIRLQNIDANRFNDTDRAYISEDYYRSVLVDYAVYPGDVLVAGLGDDSIQSGRACIAPANLGLAINKADCYCLRPGERLDANYLVAFFNSPQGADQSKSFAQGTTRIRLNLGNIRLMKVPVPDIELQQQIATELANVYQAGQDAQLRLVQQKAMGKLALSNLD